MEPRQHEAAPSMEQAPLRPGNGESLLSVNELSPERHVENAPELGQVQAEISQIAMPSLPAPVPLTIDGGADPQTSSATPLLAGDDDLIEREWVDKAKSILAATKDNPYLREKEINKLQIEYIRKRYGRNMGDAGD